MKPFIVCPLSELSQPRKDTLSPTVLPTIFLQSNVVTKWPWDWTILSLPHRASQHTVPLIESYIAALFSVQLLKGAWKSKMSDVYETLISLPHCGQCTFYLEEDGRNKAWKISKDCMRSQDYCKFLLLSLSIFCCLSLKRQSVLITLNGFLEIVPVVEVVFSRFFFKWTGNDTMPCFPWQTLLISLIV